MLGVIFGLTAGFFRGATETAIMRATDVMMAFPIYLLAVALVSVLKPSLWILIFVIGFVYWTPMTRVIHGEVLSIREKEFVAAARLTGCSNVRILYRHILPHLVAPIIVYTSLGIATTVLFEATLSYIGLGVQPPTPSWGQMISDGQNYYLSAPHLVIYPGLCIMITVLAFNLVGDGLRDAFDSTTEAEVGAAWRGAHPQWGHRQGEEAMTTRRLLWLSSALAVMAVLALAAAACGTTSTGGGGSSPSAAGRR